jgi:prephenate dehydrogenase
MDEPGFFAKSTIAIYGLGLMGGSLALALKGKCKAVIGIARKQEVCEYALANGFVDQAYTDPNEGLPQADVVVLAAPVNVIMEMIEKLPDWHPGEAIVTDIGSTKEKIVDVMSTLPPRFSPIGGHPICGKEVLGIANADRDLYKGAPYVYTPVVQTSPAARKFATELANVLGAIPLWLSPQEHDCILAATSHAPYLISAALALATPESYGPFTGSGFRSTARLAATPSSMMLDVLESNRQNVIEALERVQQNINSLLSNLNSNDFDEIKKLLDDSAVQMENILKVKQGKP